MDKLSASEQERLQRIEQARKLSEEGNNVSAISKIMKLDRRTVSKYLHGNPEILCCSRQNPSSLYARYRDEIAKWLNEGSTASNVYRNLLEKGLNISRGTARNLSNRIANELDIKINKYTRSAAPLDKSKPSKKSVYVTRRDLFAHIWFKNFMPAEQIDYVYKAYSSVSELETCVREFRDVFNKHSLSRLYLFIEKYTRSSHKEIASFAKGLCHDLEAVEEAVTSRLSNGFVEGTNSN